MRRNPVRPKTRAQTRDAYLRPYSPAQPQESLEMYQESGVGRRARVRLPTEGEQDSVLWLATVVNGKNMRPYFVGVRKSLRTVETLDDALREFPYLWEKGVLYEGGFYPSFEMAAFENEDDFDPEEVTPAIRTKQIRQIVSEDIWEEPEYAIDDYDLNDPADVAHFIEIANKALVSNRFFIYVPTFSLEEIETAGRGYFDPDFSSSYSESATATGYPRIHTLATIAIAEIGTGLGLVVYTAGAAYAAYLSTFGFDLWPGTSRYSAGVSSGRGASSDARTLWKKISKTGLAKAQEAYRGPESVSDNFPFELTVRAELDSVTQQMRSDADFWSALVQEEYDIEETANTVVDSVYSTEIADVVVKNTKPVRVSGLVFDIEVRLEGSTFLIRRIECGGSFVFTPRSIDLATNTPFTKRNYDLFYDLRQQAAEVFYSHLRSDYDFQDYVIAEIERYGELKTSPASAITRVSLVDTDPLVIDANLEVDLFVSGSEDAKDYYYTFKSAIKNGLVLDVNPALRDMFEKDKPSTLLRDILKNLDMREISDPKAVRYFVTLLRREGGTESDVQAFLQDVAEAHEVQEALDAASYFSESAQYRLNPADDFSEEKQEAAQFFFGRLFGDD